MSDRGQGHGGSVALQVEQARERVTQEARAMYLERGGGPVTAHVHYRPGPIPAAKPLVTCLAEAVLASQYEAHPSLDLDGADMLTPAREHVYGIHLYRDEDASEWQCESGGFVSATWDHVVPMVRKKEEDLHRWPAKFTERWLLVVARGAAGGKFSFTSSLPMFDRMASSTMRSTFDRVYFLEETQAKVARLA